MDTHTQNRNNKKIVLFTSVAAVVVVVALAIGILLIRVNANSASQPASISMKDARALPEEGTCLANDAAVKAKAQAQPVLSEDGGFWTSYIYDVPAGTNVDVNIASYNGSDIVTGSLAYSDGYGSYNFTATKQSSEWRYTRFARCQ